MHRTESFSSNGTTVTQPMETVEKVFAFRPSIPPTPEEASDLLLEKLEQAGRVPSKDKFRRMACNTFIFTGTCPYNDRCVFLHDYRIKAEGVKVRTTRQTRSNNTVKDTFYWPDMTRKDVIRNTDAQGLPSANQLYVIPEAFKANPNNFHNRGLYSMWAHFVEFCVHNSVFFTKKYRDLTTEPFFQTSAYRENPHVPGAKRLDTFVQLSLGVSMSWKAQIAPSSVPLIEELHVPREVEEHVEPAAPNGARRFWNEGAAASYYHVPPSVSFEPAWNAPAVRVGDANDWGSSTLDIWDGTASESFDSWEHANVCSVSGHHDRAYSPDSVILSANRSVEGLGVDRPLCIDTNSMWDASCESGAPTDSTQIHAWRDGPGTMGFASRPSSFYFPPSEIDPSLSSLQLHTPMQHQQQQQQLQPQQLPPQLPYQLQHTSSISEFYPKSNRVSSNNNSLSMLDLDLR